ncbi:MAG TPA: class I SAM-dependent methyltransferase [Kineosporiaceae bacterium]
MVRYEDPVVRSVLDALHREARGDLRRAIGKGPSPWFRLLRGGGWDPDLLRELYLPVSPAKGRFLYQIARTTGARTVVEFGTSFGISTIYLAAAVAATFADDDLGEGERAPLPGSVVATEIEPGKCAAARANLERAGLGGLVDLRQGDALATLPEALPTSVDLLFLDGHKDQYLEVLHLARDRLHPGSVVLADNANFRSVRGFLRAVRDPASGFVSSTLFRGTLEFSTLLGPAGANGLASRRHGRAGEGDTSGATG